MNRIKGHFFYITLLLNPDRSGQGRNQFLDTALACTYETFSSFIDSLNDMVDYLHHSVWFSNFGDLPWNLLQLVIVWAQIVSVSFLSLEILSFLYTSHILLKIFGWALGLPNYAGSCHLWLIYKPLKKRNYSVPVI